ncbi:MAG: hypothetical protein ACF8NJ_01220 [Phycisphaerales bacterium JB038]
MLHSPQGPPSLAQWSAHLHQLAAPASATTLSLDEVRAFRDDRGHHRASDLPFLAQRFGYEVGPAPAAAAHDVALWWALHDDGIDVDRIIDREAQPQSLHRHEGAVRGGAGGLFRQDLFQTIEVWTEADLSGLHALYHLAQRRGRPDWRRRLFEVARWHLLEVQPDNGTNHPWAVHVFLILAQEESDPQAQLHAETLLSNSLVTFGEPDAFSKHILADAARTLDAYLAGP